MEMLLNMRVPDKWLDSDYDKDPDEDEEEDSDCSQGQDADDDEDYAAAPPAKKAKPASTPSYPTNPSSLNAATPFGAPAAYNIGLLPAAAPKAPKAARRPPTSKSAKLTKKDLDTKLKVATPAEIAEFIRSANQSHPEVMTPLLIAFQPRLMPIKPTAGDPILCSCFHCGAKNAQGGGRASLTPLHKSEPHVQMCYECHCSLLGGKHAGTFTRDRVMDYFGFTKAEADKIPRTTATGGFFKSTIYVYKLASVLKAVKAKYGSLYMFVKNK